MFWHFRSLITHLKWIISFFSFVCLSFLVFFSLFPHKASYFQLCKITGYQNLEIPEWIFLTSWDRGEDYWNKIKNVRLCSGFWDRSMDCENELMSKMHRRSDDQRFMVKCIIIGTSHKIVYNQMISCKARKVSKKYYLLLSWFTYLASYVWFSENEAPWNYWCQLVSVFYVS